ncbi:MAG: hypothetical protein HY042_00810 [Spirochaetia bacterium]|nr:hypothetical protein [Spirochaetia bacterium]
MAGVGQDCKVAATENRYFLLFGAVPISKATPPVFTPEQGRTYRITEKTTWTDAAITLLGGWAVTLTRRTIEVESCAEDVLVTSRGAIEKEFAEKQEKYEKQVEARAEAAAVQFAKSESRRPVIVMNSGDNIRGDILEIDADSMLVAVEVPADESDERVDRVHLRSGGILEGRITNQDPKTITFQTGGANRVIKKSDILRSEIQVQRTKIEQRKITKRDVKKILLTEKVAR